MKWDQLADVGWANYELRKQRQPICESCDKLNSLNLCTECHCFVPLKTLWTHAECPLGKWKSINTQ